MRRYYLCFIIVLGILFGAVLAGAEPQLSSVEGVITGPDGALLPGVVVAARLEGTGDLAQTISNSSGM